MTTVLFSKKMPQKSLTSDNQTSFVLGRRAFFNKTYLSHKTENLSKNLDYSIKQYNNNEIANIENLRKSYENLKSLKEEIKTDQDENSQEIAKEIEVLAKTISLMKK